MFQVKFFLTEWKQWLNKDRDKTTACDTGSAGIPGLLTIITEDWDSEQILQNLPIPFKWTLHLLPRHKFTDLFCQFPEFLPE